MSGAYVDASALVKLFKPERETSALIIALRGWEMHLSSVVVAVEASCTAHRLGTSAARERAELATAGLTLIPLSDGILERARSRFEPPLRALDAIHLASAIELAEEVEAFFAYDSDLASAASAAGLEVRSPS